MAKSFTNIKQRSTYRQFRVLESLGIPFGISLPTNNENTARASLFVLINAADPTKDQIYTYDPAANQWNPITGTGASGDGKSAYELAVENGFTGTVVEWLASLHGDDGDSAYDVWLAAGNVGTIGDYLESLKGQNGVGVPPGGVAGQILSKKSNESFDFEWKDETGSGGGGGVIIDDEEPAPDKVYSSSKTQELADARVDLQVPLLPNVPNAAGDFLQRVSSGHITKRTTAQAKAALETIAIPQGTAAGVNTYEATMDEMLLSYDPYGVYQILFNNSNTDASTLSLDGLGVRPFLHIDGSALGEGDIVGGKRYWVLTGPGRFVLHGEVKVTGGGGPATWGGITGNIPDQTDLVAYVTGQTANGNTAFGWGDHATEGYLKSVNWSGMPSDVTRMGNAFNGPSQLALLNSGGKLIGSVFPDVLPAVDGSLLTNLPSASVNQAADYNWTGVHKFYKGSNYTQFLSDDFGNAMSSHIPGESGFYLIHGHTTPYSLSNRTIAFALTAATSAIPSQISNLLNFSAEKVYCSALYTGSLEFNSPEPKVWIRKPATSSKDMALGFWETSGYGNLSLFGHSASSGHNVRNFDFRIGPGVSSLDGGILSYRIFHTGSVSVGTEGTENSSAIFKVDSTTKGVLVPRMTTTQWNAIPSKAEALSGWSTTEKAPLWWDGTGTIGFRYNRTTSKFQGFDGTNWVDLN